MDLTDAIAPALVFWGKHALAEASVVAEASRDGGLSWSTPLATLVGSVSSTWIRYQADLTGYTGGTIRVRFRFSDSVGGSAPTDGAYIDDVEIRELPTSLSNFDDGGCPLATTTRYFCDSFESGLDQWLVSGQDWNTTSVSARTGARSLADSPEGNYSNGAHSMVVLSQPIDLSAAAAPVLAFWHQLVLIGNASAMGLDTAFVDVSGDGGSSWVELHRYGISDATTAWSLQQYSLAGYAGGSVVIRFRFMDNNLGPDNTADGWNLDDVEIRELE